MCFICLLKTVSDTGGMGRNASCCTVFGVLLKNWWKCWISEAEIVHVSWNKTFLHYFSWQLLVDQQTAIHLWNLATQHVGCRYPSPFSDPAQSLSLSLFFTNSNKSICWVDCGDLIVISDTNNVLLKYFLVQQVLLKSWSRGWLLGEAEMCWNGVVLQQRVLDIEIWVPILCS